MASKERCLVTGGAGFIGSNLVRELLSRGIAVRVLDDFSTGQWENLEDIRPDVEVIEGDLRDADAVTGAMDGVSRVFHEGAIPSVARSVVDPLSSHEANATGTLNVLMAARAAGAERVVYASSSSVYGDAETLPVHEGMATRPLSPYGVSKLAGELYAAAFHASYGMATVSLRYFNVFGPRQDPGSEYAAVVPKFVAAALDSVPAHVFGDGEQSRDFTFVADVVQANVLASEAPKEAWGRTFNVAYGGRHSVNELLAEIQRLAGGDQPPAVHDPPRTGEIRDSQADITAAREQLGYAPSSSFEEGLKATVDWFRQQRGA